MHFLIGTNPMFAKIQHIQNVSFYVQNFTINCKNFTKIGLYLAVATNGTESRKISQLLHPTLAA
jgi:hypothetical protein